MAQLSKTMPPNGHKTLMFGDVIRKWFTKQGCCYLDLWPVSYPFLMIMSPDLATQATQTIPQIAFERPPRLDEFFKPIAGGPNLFDMPEKKWKHWRAVFNKGFSTEVLSSLIPGMIEATETYCDILRDLASKGELFQLDPVTLRFTLDFIGKTVMNASLGQKESNVLADSMLSQISWLAPNKEINPLEMINIPRFLVHWWNGRKMDAYIGRELDKRFIEYQQDQSHAPARGSVIDLVLRAYMSDFQDSTDKQNTDSQPSPSDKMDPVFRSFAVTQIRSFLFLGHDSMSSTICYAIYLLFRNPGTLAFLRAEHSTVFGSDFFAAANLLADSPHLLDRLRYTTAVIKETLRLFPPGSGIRQGAPGVDLVGEDGTRYPTKNSLVWILHTAMHNDSAYWPDAASFIPERWLVEPGHRLYPRKGAWRAFEWGPRACIGQNLAMVQLRIVLVMLIRQFDFEVAYDEWDEVVHWIRNGSADKAKGLPRTYRGERAYQIEIGASHPAELMPCRVKLAE